MLKYKHKKISQYVISDLVQKVHDTTPVLISGKFRIIQSRTILCQVCILNTLY